MSESKKNCAIGLTVCASLGLVAWLLLFLHPSFGDSGFTFHVRFADIEKVVPNSRVTFAGRPVGHVVAITPIDRASAQSKNPHQPDGPIYCYDLTVAVDSQTTLYSSDEVTLSTSGLMGERYVAITPQRAPDAERLKMNQVVYANEPVSMANTFSQISELAKNTDKTVTTLNQFLQQEFVDTARAITQASNTFSHLMNTVQDTKLIESAKKSSDTLNEMLTATHSLLQSVSDGQGSLGQLLTSDAFYFQSLAVMKKVDTLMNDINSYGLLFHNNRSWQRVQKDRSEKLYRLQNPDVRSLFLQKELQKMAATLESLQAATQAAPTTKDRDLARSITEVAQKLSQVQENLNTCSLALAENNGKSAPSLNNLEN